MVDGVLSLINGSGLSTLEVLERLRVITRGVIAGAVCAPSSTDDRDWDTIAGNIRVYAKALSADAEQYAAEAARLRMAPPDPH
jgi:hypothetical protein